MDLQIGRQVRPHVRISINGRLEDDAVQVLDALMKKDLCRNAVLT